MSNSHSPLRLNVGFFVQQSIGFSREFPIHLPKVHLEPDLDMGDLTGTVRITRTPQGLLVQARMHASLPSECVRCLSGFQQPLEIAFTELYAFSKRSITDSGLLLPEDGHIDLAPLVREYMLLEIPISPLCSAGCKGLCPICGENLNEVACHHEPLPGDPRLSVLKSLLDQDQPPQP